MTTVFHVRLDGTFIEIKHNLRRKKLKDPVLLGAVLGNRDNARALIQFRRERQSHYLKNDFSSKTDPSTISYPSNEMKQAQFSQNRNGCLSNIFQMTSVNF